MQREQIEAFVREMVESEWLLNPNARRTRGEVTRLITDRWLRDRRAYGESLRRHPSRVGEITPIEATRTRRVRVTVEIGGREIDVFTGTVGGDGRPPWQFWSRVRPDSTAYVDLPPIFKVHYIDESEPSRE